MKPKLWAKAQNTLKSKTERGLDYGGVVAHTNHFRKITLLSERKPRGERKEQLDKYS